jgi:penicillin amidase
MITAAFVAFFWGRKMLAASLPRISGELSLPGLSKQVEIYRDEYGIPHVYAQNEDDLMFAVGFVCAQDRLFQMDIMRRAATGRLAEIFGESILESDLLVRTIGFEQIAKRQITYSSPETLAMLRAYSNGVNACIDRLNALPPEFRMLGYRPERWQPTDTLAISRLLAWQLSFNFESEIVMLKIAARLGLRRALELGPAYPPTGPFIIPAAISENPPALSKATEGARLLDAIVGSPGGSNSWVIGPSLSKSNAPILANDPHLSGTRLPSLWYYVHLVGGDYDVIGGLVPGTPLPMLGHNRRIGWGLTNMTADIQDLFIERLNPQDLKEYEYDGRWVEMDTRTERISFLAAKHKLSYIEKEIKRTIHGPLLNDIVPGVADAISLSWTGLEPTLEFESLPAISKAGNWDEFCRALSKFGVAPQNFIFADVDGNIGYYGAGIVPVRSTGIGIYPLKGWTSETAWKGFIPFDEMPHALNPTEGFIVTANNRVIGSEYNHFLGAEWAPRFRYERITELIKSQDKHDAQDIAQMQGDSTSLLAKLVCESILPALENLPDQASREAVMRLKGWNFDNSADSVAATIYHEFFLKFTMNTFVDEMGEELAKEYLEDYYLWLERFALLMQQGSRWFDDVRTEKVETRDDMAARSFQQAVSTLKKKLGNDISKWRWGRVHTVELRHPLDRNRIVKTLFNMGPFPFPGDGETINRATFDFNQPYLVTMTASIRHIMDFSHVQNTLGIHTSGQSGNPASHHYSDLSPKWLKGEYIDLMMDREDFTEDMEGRLILKPVSSAARPAM